MAEYAGARRAAPGLSDAGLDTGLASESDSGLDSRLDGDDAPLSCPECGSLVRADQQWCTLCLHVLHQPAPAPAPEPAPEAATAPGPTAETAPAPADLAAEPGAAPAPAVPGLSPEVEAAADALIAQLAAETHRDSLKVPPFLRSKAQRTVAIVVAGSVLTTLVVAALDVLGAAFH